MTIYLVAGEASGDNHGAALMEALRRAVPEVRLLGRGGPRMQRFGGERFLDWSEEAGVVGLWEVVKHYGYFRQEFRKTLNEIAATRPDAVVLIDYPGFNLRLARALREKSLGGKITYYISPQVWAWNRRRIPKMARWLDLMICLFPFEKELYEASGLRTEFAGHPMLDELEKKRLPDVSRDLTSIGLFPGSREREVRKILPIMLEAGRILHRRHPELRFAIPAASEKLLTLIREMTAGFPHCEVTLRNAYPLMQTCGAGLIASGTATLEAAFLGLPYALLYKVSPLTYEVGRRVIRVPFLGMVNILAGREVIPEFVQKKADPTSIAMSVESFLFDPQKRLQLESDLRNVIAMLGERGAASKAAQAVCELLT